MSEVLRDTSEMNEKKPEEASENTAAETAFEDDKAYSELDEQLWSVLSFDHCRASGLKYGEAVGLRKKLEAERVTGLCIVTDEVAARLTSED